MKWWIQRNKQWCVAVACAVLLAITVLGLRNRINPLRVEKIVVYGQELTDEEMRRFLWLYNTSRLSAKHPGCEPCTVDDRIYIYYADGSYLSIVDHGSHDWEFQTDYCDREGKYTDRKRVYVANERLDEFVQALVEKYGLCQ